METIVTAILVGIVLLVCVAIKKDDITSAQKDINERKKAGNQSSYTGGCSGILDANAQLDTSRFYANTNKKSKSNGTKEIVKDAVIGGIVAGPAGAVVGAIVGKEKAEKME